MKKNGFNIINDLFDENFSFLQIKNDIFNLRTNIKELETKYIFEIDVAGLTKEQIDINVEEGYLCVEINERKENEESQYTYLRKEIVYKNTKRKYYIGNIKENQINAKLNNGLLEIEIPKENEKESNSKIVIN